MGRAQIEDEWLAPPVRVMETSPRPASGHLRACVSPASGQVPKPGGDGVRRYVQPLTDPEEGLVIDGRMDQEALDTPARPRKRHHAGQTGLADAPRRAPGLPGEPFLPGSAP